MARHLACLTFDFDAMSHFIPNGKTSPTPISRGEFGPNVGAPRILALLKKYRIPTSWYIPGYTLETYPDSCKRVFDAGHEIGHHGWTHVAPASLSREKEEAELVRGNEQIRKLTDCYARGYRSPAWDLSPHSIKLLLKHGFVYDSSMMAGDYMPYRVRQGDTIELEKPMVFGKHTKLIEAPVSWSLDDYPLLELNQMNYNLLLENWIDDFLYMKKTMEWGVFQCTFHPQVIGRGGRMLVLEKLRT